MLVADFIFTAAIIAMTAASLYFASRIPRDRIAMQWDFNGNPTWSAPKSVGVWALVVFALAARLLIWIAMTFAPETVHGAALGLIFFAVIVTGAHLFILVRAAQECA